MKVQVRQLHMLDRALPVSGSDVGSRGTSMPLRPPARFRKVNVWRWAMA